jgi:hypothetical protein
MLLGLNPEFFYPAQQGGMAYFQDSGRPGAVPFGLLQGFPDQLFLHNPGGPLDLIFLGPQFPLPGHPSPRDLRAESFLKARNGGAPVSWVKSSVPDSKGEAMARTKARRACQNEAVVSRFRGSGRIRGGFPHPVRLAF